MGILGYPYMKGSSWRLTQIIQVWRLAHGQCAQYLKIRFSFKYILGCGFQWLFFQIHDCVLVCQRFLNNFGLPMPLFLLFQFVALYIFSFIFSVLLSLSPVDLQSLGPEERQLSVLILYLGVTPWSPLSRGAESHKGSSPEDYQIPCLERLWRARHPFCKWGCWGSEKGHDVLKKMQLNNQQNSEKQLSFN